MHNLRLSGALAVQRGTLMLQTFAEASLAVPRAAIDVYDAEKGTGYQRVAIKSRVTKAASYYTEGGRMPNPLLVNIRADDFAQAKITITSGDPEEYDLALAERGHWIGTGIVELPEDIPLWIFDGQHRKDAIGYACAADEDTFGSFPIPISLTLGLDPAGETREFFQVNSNALGVKTDLAWRLMTHMSDADPNFAAAIHAQGKNWIVRADKVVDALEALPGTWTGRFQEANQRKVRGVSTIPRPQFSRSLKPVLDSPVLQRSSAEDIAQIVNAYWTGISMVLPEAFESPADFVLQKGLGTVALHRVLPQVIEVIRSRGGRLADPKVYAEVMKELPTLTGDAVSDDGELVARTGVEFWRVGSVASAMSGDAGRRRVATLIASKLPSPSETYTL